MTESLKKMYVDILKRHIDSPDTFIEACAYSIISSTLGRQYSYLHPDTVYPFRPNVFFMLSCIPGRGRRSSVLNNWNYSYKKILASYYEKLANKPGINIEDLIDSTKFSGGSVQGVADHIREAITTYGINEFVNFNTEYSATIKLMAPGKYSEGLGFLKCCMYYGEEWSEDLSQRKKKEEQKCRRKVPGGLYINSLTGLQEIGKVLHSGISDNGLLRREIIVYEDEFSMDTWKPPLRPVGEMPYTIREELNTLSLAIADRMVENERFLKETHKDFITINLYPSVLDKINAVARLDDTKISKRDRQNIDIIRQTRWEHIMKLAILEAISRCDVKRRELVGFKPEYYIDVLPEDEVKAFNFLERVHKFDKVISDALEEKKPYRTRTEPFDEIVDFIASGQEGKTGTEVYNRFHKKYDDLTDLLLNLQRAGRIVYSEERRSTTGPTTSVYRIPPKQ